MPAQLISGEVIASRIKEEVKREVESLKQEGKEVHLVAIQVGENPASEVYLRSQSRLCEEAGIKYTLHTLPADTSEESLVAYIEGLNKDPKITGIILQMPLPKGINAQKVQSSIAPHKDVEGMNLANMGQLVYGKARLAPCTAVASVELIKSTVPAVRGKEVVILGRSAIVGKPLALLMLDLDATPTICHTKTRDLTFHTRRADILVVAAGKPGLIKADMIKPGAVVIDVGINRVPEYDVQGNPVLDKKGKQKMKTVGDVDFEGAKEVASFITPVPGGVGPVTTVMLLRNAVESAKGE
ncbi:MAG TPA: bifunctional 5,10-methylenetetrahydrofolate dehydrogenase/5,10-methenyltetrahydrofolate cyclohydrolase [Candidatus Hypogeohydataceae bacterium YC40]